MVYFSNAKINIGLQVTDKRADGYHNLVSVLYPVQLYDVVEIMESPNNETTFESYGIPIPEDGTNLCIKAYELLKKDFDLPAVRIYLLKNIPVGAGLGGGSSNAATVLKGLNEQFALHLSNEELKRYAAQLGADCPFFIENTPQLATGTGVELSEIKLSLKGFYIVLVKPDIHISTAEAYRNVVPMFSDVDLKKVIQFPVQDWKFYIKNDFEEGIFAKHKTIRFLKEAFYEAGAVYASMTGSGSAVYGIFWEPVSLPELKKFGTVYYPVSLD